MTPAAKVVFASYLLVNGLTDPAKKIIDTNYANVWAFMQQELSFKLI